MVFNGLDIHMSSTTLYNSYALEIVYRRKNRQKVSLEFCKSMCSRKCFFKSSINMSGFYTISGECAQMPYTAHLCYT